VHPIKWENPKPAGKYNLVAVGAGTAGLVTAAVAAGLGAKVAIIEEHMFGGDCLNFGCVPSKAILRSAKIAYDAIIRGKEFGVNVTNGGKIEMDFGAVMERVRKCRAQISSHDAAERFTKVYNMDVFIGRGKFLSADTIGVTADQGGLVTKLKFARCVIGTGAKASVPPIDGLKDVVYLTNQTVWNLTERPARLGVIGSGPIGSELAQAFALLGSDVTVLNRSDRILGKEDIDAANVVKKSMENCGVKFVTGLKFKNVSYKDQSIGFKSGIVVTIENNKKDGAEEKYEFDHIIIATGRKPNVTGLDLEKAKVKYDKRKGIEVNDFLQTSNNNIYAAGDCCTRYQFTHMADAMAKIVVRNALFFGRSKVSNLVIPWATYTFPEVAHVGLYATDAKDKGIAIDEFKVDIEHNDRAVCDGEDHGGFVKVICKKGTDKILGATIVSDNAGDIINEYTLAIQTNTGLGFFTGVIYPYPTVGSMVSASASEYIKTKLTPLNKVLLRRILQARR